MVNDGWWWLMMVDDGWWWLMMVLWLVVDLPIWKMMEFVSWDYCSQYMESHKIHVPNHQPVMKVLKIFRGKSTIPQVEPSEILYESREDSANHLSRSHGIDWKSFYHVMWSSLVSFFVDQPWHESHWGWSQFCFMIPGWFQASSTSPTRKVPKFPFKAATIITRCLRWRALS